MKVIVDPHMAPHAEPTLICSRYLWDCIKAQVDGTAPPTDPALEGMAELERMFQLGELGRQMDALSCPHPAERRVTAHEADEYFYPREGCGACNQWFGPPMLRERRKAADPKAGGEGAT